MISSMLSPPLHLFFLFYQADGSNMSGPANGPGAARSKQWRAVAAALRNESRRNSDARAAELLQQLLARDLAEAILGQVC
jgi:hypothetical protein